MWCQDVANVVIRNVSIQLMRFETDPPFFFLSSFFALKSSPPFCPPTRINRDHIPSHLSYYATLLSCICINCKRTCLTLSDSLTIKLIQISKSLQLLLEIIENKHIVTLTKINKSYCNYSILSTF